MVEDYFTSYGTDLALLCHCDSEDEKPGCRFRLFNRWHRHNGENMNVYTDGKEVEVNKPGGSTTNEYLGFIVFGEERKLVRSAPNFPFTGILMEINGGMVFTKSFNCKEVGVVFIAGVMENNLLLLKRF